MTITALDHLVLTVADLDATIRFYCDDLGMTLEEFSEGGERKALRFGTQKINLHRKGHEFEPKALLPTPGSGDLCLLTDEPVDALASRLKRAGHIILQGPVARQGAVRPLRSIYLRDPDGNLVELANEAGSNA